MDKKRLKQVITYGWKHAGEISADVINNRETSRFKGRLLIFFDIIRCYQRYSLWSNQYRQYKFYSLSNDEREAIGTEIKKTNIAKAQWTDYYYANQRFFKKWGGQDYECDYNSSQKRNQAYKKQYNFGDGCVVRQNVFIQSTHHQIGNFIVGHNVAFGRNTEIDFTGGLIIGNGVDIAERTMILTHGHDLFGMVKNQDLLDTKTRAYVTPLVIEDNVFMGAQSIIMPGVNKIGENAVIAAGSVVTGEVPPNVIVAGNPAKVMGKLPRVYYRYPKEK